MAILEPTAKADTANIMQRINDSLRVTEAKTIQGEGIEHLAEQISTDAPVSLKIGTLEQMRKIHNKVK